MSSLKFFFKSLSQKGSSPPFKIYAWWHVINSLGFLSFKGRPILRQIYASHCIALSSHYYTVKKHNNEERSKVKTKRNLTKPCIKLSEYWTSMFFFTNTVTSTALYFRLHTSHTHTQTNGTTNSTFNCGRNYCQSYQGFILHDVMFRRYHGNDGRQSSAFYNLFCDFCTWQRRVMRQHTNKILII